MRRRKISANKKGGDFRGASGELKWGTRDDGNPGNIAGSRMIVSEGSERGRDAMKNLTGSEAIKTKGTLDRKFPLLSGRYA